MVCPRSKVPMGVHPGSYPAGELHSPVRSFRHKRTPRTGLGGGVVAFGPPPRMAAAYVGGSFQERHAVPAAHSPPVTTWTLGIGLSPPIARIVFGAPP